jgi:alkylation response protein AidB-like acyl-CoA dehydrogenase
MAVDERIFPAWADAERLEASLGDPFIAASPLSFASAVEADEREAYPESSIATLQKWGYHRHFVPAADGGRLESLESALALVRAVSRRDLTVAIALGQTFLGSVPVWLAGNDRQRATAARVILEGGQMALALTEERHGADLLATEVRADAIDGGYTVNGTKWLINNGTRGSAFSVFVRTEERSGPRSFSMFLVKRSDSPSAGITSIPKVRTLGIRGADISGLRFADAHVPASACLGAAGSGLELLLKALQITRTGCTAFSLGAADTALRITLDFVRSRALYGGTAWDLPHVRTALVDAFLDILIAETISLAATRILQAAPGQASITAAIAKYEVPVRIERVIRELGTVIGARHYLREGLADGVFQKLSRDAAVVSLFDGSTAVNLDALSSQIPGVLRRVESADPPRAVFALGAPLPKFDGSRFRAFAEGDDVIGALRSGSILKRLEAQASRAPTAVEAALLLRPLVDELAALGPWMTEFVKREKLRASRSAPMLEAARRYCSLWAAGALVELWLHNREESGPFLSGGVWLAPALGRLQPVPARRSSESEAAVADHLLCLHDAHRVFSFVPLVLPDRTSVFPTTNNIPQSRGFVS